MPLTKIETKHTYNNKEKLLPLGFLPMDAYSLNSETHALDSVFMEPIRFDVKYPEQGDELNERTGRKINIKNIKLMLKTEIPKYAELLGSNTANPLYYLTKGLYGIIKHSQTVDTQGAATAQNIQGSTYGLPRVSGSAQVIGNFDTTAGTTAIGRFYNVPEAQLSTIQGTASAQQITAVSNLTQFDHLILPPRKLKLKLRIMIVKAAKDYFDDEVGEFSPHKALEWFVLNRVYVGNDPQRVDNEIKLSGVSNTDMILRESSDYSGQYSIKFDKIITHTVGIDEMLTFDIPVSQDITFNSDSNTPTNKDTYHVLIFPPFTNKGLSGPYGYEKLPDLEYDYYSPSEQGFIDGYYKDDAVVLYRGYSQIAWIKLLSNVKLQYLDF